MLLENETKQREAGVFKRLQKYGVITDYDVQVQSAPVHVKIQARYRAWLRRKCISARSAVYVFMSTQSRVLAVSWEFYDINTIAPYSYISFTSRKRHPCLYYTVDLQWMQIECTRTDRTGTASNLDWELYRLSRSIYIEPCRALSLVRHLYIAFPRAVLGESLFLNDTLIGPCYLHQAVSSLARGHCCLCHARSLLSTFYQTQVNGRLG